jgi:plastocyanin
MAARRWMESLALVAVVALVGLGLGACGGSGGSSGDGGGEHRRVLVDYKHDQFAGSFLSYFPKRVKVHAGDTVEFRQYWSGEPHSVTMGTLVDELGQPFWDILDPLFAGEDVQVPEEEPDAPDFFEKLPFMLDEESLEVIQAGAQPCYLDEGAPDFSDYDKPCPPRPQPAFNGRQSYYSSGFIPFQGAKGNTFELPLADDIAPGTYHYYCNLHFVGMSGTVEVVPDGDEIPSQDVVNRQAQREAIADAKLLQEALDRVERSRPGTSYVGVPMGDEFEAEHPLFHAQIDEFVPSTVEARVGKPVTWTWAGFHDIAFNVPKYFPLAEVKKDGTVTVDRRAFEAVKFPAPQRPEPPGGEDGGDGGPPPDPIVVDGGTFDGSGGLHSTGADYNEGDQFTLTFTKEGTYLYACLIHPAMVGKVVVR